MEADEAGNDAIYGGLSVWLEETSLNVWPSELQMLICAWQSNWQERSIFSACRFTTGFFRSSIIKQFLESRRCRDRIQDRPCELILVKKQKGQKHEKLRGKTSKTKRKQTGNTSIFDSSSLSCLYIPSVKILERQKHEVWASPFDYSTFT